MLCLLNIRELPVNHRHLLRSIHGAVGCLALATIVAFMTCTIWAEWLSDPAAIVKVKTVILWSLPLPILAMASTGLSGLGLGGHVPRGLAADKVARMKIAGPNGLLVLTPCAVFLARKAQSGQLDAAFWAVQAVELLAGALNITLLTLNLRDGLRMAARRKTAR